MRRNMLKPQLARGELRTDRRDHARRISQIHREGRRARAPLPAGHGRRAERRGHHRHPARTSRSATRFITACASRIGASSRPPTLSHRYITDRFLPDKAIDLIDEAASRFKMELDSMPTEIDAARTPDHAARNGAAGAEEGKGRRQQGAARQARKGARRPQGAERPRSRPNGRRRRKRSRDRGKLRSKIEQVKARSSSRPSAAATSRRPSETPVRHDPELETTARGRQTKLNGASGRSARCSRRKSTEEDIAKVVCDLDGHSRLAPAGGRAPEAGHMEERLHERVIGQDEAIKAVSNAVRRARAGLAGREPADRHLHVPRPDRRRQDRAVARPSPNSSSTTSRR